MPQHERDAHACTDCFQACQSLVTAAAISLAAEESQVGLRRSRYLRMGFGEARLLGAAAWAESALGLIGAPPL